MSILATSYASSPPITTKYEEQEMTKTFEQLYYRYKDRMMTLPKDKGWISEKIYLYQGFWFDSMRVASLVTVMAAQDIFKAQPTDIYLATMPKCGTTWLKSLTFAIVNRTNLSSTDHPLLIRNPHILVPSIESEILNKNPTYADGHSPRIFGAHIPYSLLPQSILDSGCRIVHMCRNPKDVFVSFFYFAQKLRHESLGVLSLDEAFELFTKGVSPSGPYWDYVKGYYKASLEHPTTILLLTYEDMKRNTMDNVKRLADFLGYPFTKEEETNGVIQEIIQLCSFENLKEANKKGDLGTMIPNDVFFRKGKIGDWSNHLTDEMAHIIDRITDKEFHSLNLSF